MSLQLVSGLLANTGLGTIYRSIASKYSLLSKIPLKIQMRAFAYGAVVQGIFMYGYPPQESEGFSKRKAFEVLSPYLLISTSIAICHRQAFKANIMSTAVLGTIQLAVSQLSPKIVTAPPLMVLRDFDPEREKNLLKEIYDVSQGDLILDILKFAGKKEMWIGSQLSKRTIFEQKIYNILISPLAFGKADWAKYFGDVGAVPDIPKGMVEILKSQCPFNPGQKVKDTHVLVLIPKTVNGKPFTLNLLQELIQNPKEKTATDFHFYSPAVNELAETPIEKSYWILMTKDVIPGSRNETYDKQKQLVKEKGGDDYEPPRAIEAAASILMHYFKTDEHLYGTDPWTFTFCRETVTEKQWPVAIGGFSRGGLFVRDGWYGYNYCDCGVAAVRKF